MKADRSDRVFSSNVFSPAAMTPVPGDVAPLGPSGLYTGSHGTRYGDGKVGANDAAEVLRIASGLDPAP